MKLYTLYLLIANNQKNELLKYTDKYKSNFLAIYFIDTLDSLKTLSIENNSILFSYGTSIIVPKDILDKFKHAINLHAASPEYPGRDPHHFAVFNQASQYGATLHIMTEKVDAGPILDTELFQIPASVSVTKLLSLANQAAIRLLERFLQHHIFDLDKFVANHNTTEWGSKKTSRKDFVEACAINPSCSKDMFDKKYRAFQEGIDYKNLYIDLYGHRFRYDGQIDQNKTQEPVADFSIFESI